MKPYHYLNFILPSVLAILLTGCAKNDPSPVYLAGSDQSINNWVLDSMKVYYYWNTGLPKNPDLNQQPLNFFNKIKNNADRFSQLFNPDVAASYNPTLSSTFGFDIASVTNAAGLQTVITSVVPGSEAESAGLLRGNELLKINNTSLSGGNIEQVVKDAINKGTILLTLKDSHTVTITGSIVSDKPVYLYKTFNSGNKTTGYLFLNAFEERAISDIQQAFSYFKSRQIGELILDMRYNPGGEVRVAAYLSALISNRINPNNIFAEFRGNSNAGTRRSTFAAEINRIPVSYGAGFDQLLNIRPNINRIYILTGRHTGSAAEMVINCLSPYITVVRVGETTLGKDMASFEIKDNRDPVQIPKWSIHPLIFKLYNAAGAGNYASGLQPDIYINELASLPLQAFGDENDPLIAAVLNKATGALLTRKMAGGTVPALQYDSKHTTDQTSGTILIQR